MSTLKQIKGTSHKAIQCLHKLMEVLGLCTMKHEGDSLT